MTSLGLVLDMLLAATLLLLAWRILQNSDLFQAVVLFITFGLVMALTWVRLDAPDIALAESAVGAGLTGVLLLDSLRRMQLSVTQNDQLDDPCETDGSVPCPGSGHYALAFAATAGLAVLLCFTLFDLPRTNVGLTSLVQTSLSTSGIDHPVSAVLLNFRAFDTWFEMGVLVLAVLGILCIRECPSITPVRGMVRPKPILYQLVQGLTPMVVLVAGYLLWLGTFAPGGAFQAGVVLGAGLVLLWMSGHPSVAALPNLYWRILVVLGFVLFLLCGCLALVQGYPFLSFPQAQSGLLLIVVEIGSTLSIGVIMAGMVLALQPMPDDAHCEVDL